MPRYVSVYARCLKSKNSTGPNDPTAHIFRVSDACPYPEKLIAADAVRYIAEENGDVVYSRKGVVRETIGTPRLDCKAFIAAVRFSVDTTVEALEKDLRPA